VSGDVHDYHYRLAVTNATATNHGFLKCRSRHPARHASLILRAGSARPKKLVRPARRLARRSNPGGAKRLSLRIRRNDILRIEHPSPDEAIGSAKHSSGHRGPEQSEGRATYPTARCAQRIRDRHKLGWGNSQHYRRRWSKPRSPTVNSHLRHAEAQDQPLGNELPTTSSTAKQSNCASSPSSCAQPPGPPRTWIRGKKAPPQGLGKKKVFFFPSPSSLQGPTIRDPNITNRVIDPTSLGNKFPRGWEPDQVFHDPSQSAASGLRVVPERAPVGSRLTPEQAPGSLIVPIIARSGHPGRGKTASESLLSCYGGDRKAGCAG